MINKKNHHLFAGLFLLICTTGYLFDVLFFEKHLSAFDFVLQKPSWNVEFGDHKAQHNILSDSPTAHYPYKKEFWESARQGYNSQYLSHIFTGKPTSGQGVGIFSTSLFQFFMDIPNALDFSTWFRLLLAGVLMYLFLYQLGVSSAPATLAAVAWIFNLHQIGWLMFPQHLATQLWLPLLLMINLVVLKNPRNISAVLGLILCLILFYSSGYTQIVLYTFIFIGLFNSLYILFEREIALSIKLKNWLLLHCVYLFAGLLLLPDALWQAQEIKEGLRGTQSFRYDQFHEEFSLTSLSALFSDLFPNSIEVARFLNPIYRSEFGGSSQIRHLFESNAVEVQAYFGLLTIYLTVYGVLRGCFQKHRLLIVLTIMLLFSTALFNGNSTIISALNLIPFAGSGSYSRIITLLIFTAVVIAGFGGQFLIEDMKAKRYSILAISFMIIFSWLIGAKLSNPDTLALKEFIPWLGCLAIFSGLAIVFSRIDKVKFLVPLAVLFTFLDLTAAGYQFNTRMDKELHFPENTIISKIRQDPENFRTALLMNHTGYHHNILSYYDLSTLGGYETTIPNDYVYFMKNAYRNLDLTLNGILFLFVGNIEILRMLNTHYVVSNLDPVSPILDKVYQNEAEALYKIKDPLARVYCATNQLVNSNAMAIPAQLALEVQHFDRPVIVTQALLEGDKMTTNCNVSELNVYTSKLEFVVESDQSTIVFIPTNFHPYWRASANGEKIIVHKANYSFMALTVEPGSTKIKLEFINNKLTIEAVIQLLLGLMTLFVAVTRIHTPWKKVIFISCGVLFIGKSMMSIPGVMNTNILEKPPVIEQEK